MPGSPGYDAIAAEQRDVGDYDEVDIAGAQALLEEAGVTTPIQVRFHYAANNPRRASEYELIRDSAAQAGFERASTATARLGRRTCRTPTSTTPPCSAGSRPPSASPTRRRTSSPTGRTTTTATPSEAVDGAVRRSSRRAPTPAAQQELAAADRAAARGRRLRRHHLPVPGGHWPTTARTSSERLDDPAVADDVLRLLGVGGRRLIGADHVTRECTGSVVRWIGARPDGPGADHDQRRRPIDEGVASTWLRSSPDGWSPPSSSCSASSFIVYMMMANAGDPLAFLVEIQRPGAARGRRGDRSRDEPQPRHTRSSPLLPVARRRAPRRLRHLGPHPAAGRRRPRVPGPDDAQAGRRGVASCRSLVGIAVGIVTALRQYSGFDYLVSFFTFVFFSLPVFWVAVILKGLGGINFNDWLRDSAQFSPTFYRPRRAVRRRSSSTARRRARRGAGSPSPLIGGGRRHGAPDLHLGHQLAARPRVRPGRARRLRRRHRRTASPR